jgi:hypothetical protein
MVLGLTVTLVMLGVIATLGALGYFMDKQVDRNEPKDGPATRADSSTFSKSTRG